MSGKPFIALIAWLLIMPLSAAADSANPSPVQLLLHGLDYIAVDYKNAVVDGEVKNADEYAEQKEFAAQLDSYLKRLPAGPENTMLAERIAAVQSAIEGRRSGEFVAQLCQETSRLLIRTFNVNVAPAVAPSLEDGRRLYRKNCTGCHGPDGYGDGPQAHLLSPPPANFHDTLRQSQRSLYSLYTTLSLGVEGTAMPSFRRLDRNQRWDLAFYISQFYASDAMRRHGEAMWQQSHSSNAITDLAQLSTMTPQQAEVQAGADGQALLAYLRAHPEQLAPDASDVIGKSQKQLRASLDAYRQGYVEKAYDLAASAYLEGFELAEAHLRTVAPKLRLRIERAMADYRNAVRTGNPIEDLAKRNSELQSMLADAGEAIQRSGDSQWVTLFSSMLILLREGLEAILVVAAIGAFLAKADRLHHINYVHIGWSGALAMGAITWFLAQNFITISGAQREFTEGIAALVAAAMLLYVGFWLHRQSTAQHWQRFLSAKIGAQINKGAVWGLVLVTFVAVYREVLESVLFYQTFWLQSSTSGRPYIVSGFVAAATILALASWGIFRFSIRLPLRPFFLANMVLLVFLSLIYTGKGIVALQETGHLRADTINFPQIDLLGIYPTLETIGAQLVILLLVLGWLSRARIRNRSHAT